MWSELICKTTIIYFLVAPGLIDSNSAAPSLVEKKVPHLGHLTRLSFDTEAHPREKQITINRTRLIFIFAFIHFPLSPVIRIIALRIANPFFL